ncbi:MAG: methyltransferase domain-containing protein [Leptospirales bacterium]|nr:methyltransferase domain-containing protein [Leptospirales bacterium]
MSRVGDEIEAPNAGWTFGGDVPRTFDSHVSRSVPLYNEGHDLILKVSDYFVGDGSLVYDLGCSTGELLRKLAARHSARSMQLIGVDREAAMVAEARSRGAEDPRITFVHEELTECELQPCDLVVAYYTMQFVRPAFRQELFDRVYRALRWGGAFLLFEKVRGPDARFQDILTGLYNDFKSERGFSSDEILAKTRSLKGVLEPFSTQGNLELLQRSGFKDCTTVMKYICFEGFLAIK